MKKSLYPHYARYKHKLKTVDLSSRKKRIILISDTHITQGGPFNADIFKQALTEIERIKNVDYVIHLGDLTHNGTFLDYEYATTFLKGIMDEKFFIIPGNHDAKNVGYLLFEEIFGSRTFEIDTDDIYILGLDSSIPDMDQGRIGKRTIERIGNIFLSKKNKLKILCFHHPLIPIPLTGRERSAIIDAGDTLEMILKSNIDVVLNGHRHISNIYSCSDGEKELVIFNSGTTSSNKTRYRELFTYSILDIYKNSLTFKTKKIMDREFIKRGRYINRTFHSNKTRKNEEAIVRIVHIANTHFSHENFMEEIYQEAIRQINEIKANIVIHSGDITNANKLPEFEIAASKLSHIQHPMLIIPGNNDLQTFGWELFQQWIGPLDPYFEDQGVRVIGINSIDRTIGNGNVGRKKMGEIIDLIKNQKDSKINIVTFYNNIIAHPKSRIDSMLSDSGAVLKNFTLPENHIDFILTGHDHISFSLQIEDTIVSSCGSLSSQDYLDMNGNSYSIIYCYKDGYVEVERVYVRSKLKEITGRFWINLHEDNGDD